MSCDTYAGKHFRLIGQMNTGNYALAPTPVDALKLKFNEVSLNRNPMRQTDPTINDAVLDSKESETDETPEGSITTVACLNDALFWMTALFGPPVTTGVGPYTHTFTMTNDCKPDFLLELIGQLATDPPPAARYRRFLGTMVRDFAWDIMGDDQNFVMNLLMARSVRPFPVAAFDATPQAYVRDRTLAARGLVYDVDGASTLGYISGATLNINLNPEPRKLADGEFGYGLVQPGQIMLSGTVMVLLQDTGISLYGDAQTTKPMTIETIGELGGTFQLNLPSVEFSEASSEVTTKQGIVRTHNWRAFYTLGDAAVTAVLVNSIASLETP